MSDDTGDNRGIESRLDRLVDIQLGQGERLDRLVDIQLAQGERLDGVSERLDRLVDIQLGQGERLDGVSERLDGLADIQLGQGERLDGVSERLDRLVEGQTRGFTAVVEAIGGLANRIDNVLLGPLGSRVREHDDAIGELRARVSRLEARHD